jgi:hypothetical protein
VQDEVDENAEKTKVYSIIDLSKSPDVNYRVASSTKKFTTKTSDKQRFVPVVGGADYLIVFSNDVPWGNYSWVTNINVSSGGTPAYCVGETNVHSVVKGTSARISAPLDAKYILITTSNQGTDTSPSYLYKIEHIVELDRSVQELEGKIYVFHQELPDVVGSGIKSTGEFQTSDSSYVISSSNYGYWYDVTSLAGGKIKLTKGVGPMRIAFTNAIINSSTSDLSSYLLSNIIVSDVDFVADIPLNSGNSVYMWIHYIKGGVSRNPSSKKVGKPDNVSIEEQYDSIDSIKKETLGVGTATYNGEKINLRDEYYRRTTAALMDLDAGTSSAYLQGADVYGDLFFQFYAGGRCCVYDLTTLTKVKEFTMDNLNKSSSNLAHWGSVHFSNEFANVGDELPLLYTEGTNIAGAGGDVAVVNINAAYAGTGDAEVVRFITLIDYPYPNVCCAFDFNRGIGYMIGRPVAAERFGRYYLQPFSISDGSYDINNLIDVKSSGPLQDATFRNGVVYIVSGWNNLYSSEGYSNYAVPQIVTAVNVTRKAITAVLETGIVSSSNAGEPEGIGIYDNNFYVSRRSSSTNNKLMRIEV